MFSRLLRKLFRGPERETSSSAKAPCIAANPDNPQENPTSEKKANYFEDELEDQWLAVCRLSSSLNGGKQGCSESGCQSTDDADAFLSVNHAFSSKAQARRRSSDGILHPIQLGQVENFIHGTVHEFSYCPQEFSLYHAGYYDLHKFSGHVNTAFESIDSPRDFAACEKKSPTLVSFSPDVTVHSFCVKESIVPQKSKKSKNGKNNRKNNKTQ